MGRIYNFGIIGLGAIARFHAQAINGIPDARLYAGYDPVEGRAEAFTSEFGGKAYSDLEAFLADKEMDIVTITTPSGCHRDVAIAALDAGFDVVVEKPLEITVSRCNDIIQAAERNGRKLGAVFQSRYYDSSRVVKDAIEKGRLGKIVMVDAYVKWYRSQEYYDSGAWRGTKAVDGGGALMNQSIHAVDLLQWFGGDVDEVCGVSGTVAHRNIEVEDVLVSTVRFKNGALGVIEASTSVWPGFFKRMEILGTDGSIVLEEESIKEWRFKDETEEDELVRKRFATTGTGGGASDPNSIGFEGHRKEFEDFIDAVRHDRRPAVDGIEGRKAVSIIEAVYKSCESGAPVKVC